MAKRQAHLHSRMSTLCLRLRACICTCAHYPRCSPTVRSHTHVHGLGYLLLLPGSTPYCFLTLFHFKHLLYNKSIPPVALAGKSVHNCTRNLRCVHNIFSILFLFFLALPTQPPAEAPGLTETLVHSVWDPRRQGTANSKKCPARDQPFPCQGANMQTCRHKKDQESEAKSVAGNRV